MPSAIDRIGSGDLPLLSFIPGALPRPILHTSSNKDYKPISAKKNDLLQVSCLSRIDERIGHGLFR